MMCYYLNVHFQGQRVKVKAGNSFSTSTTIGFLTSVLCIVVKYPVRRNSVACVGGESRPPPSKKLIARQTASHETKNQVFCDIQLRRWAKQ